MDYIIGIDVGTTATKAVAFGTKGGILSEYSLTYALFTPQPGYCEQDPEEIFQVVLQVIRQVVQQHRALHLAGICFSSAMHSLIAMNAAGETLSPCLTWADTRSEAEAATLRNLPEGRAIYEATGIPIHPMSPLCKMLWFRKHEPSLFSHASKFISIKEYIFFRLFGLYIIDYSMASATGLFNLFTLQWHPEALSAAGITTSHLSAPVPPTHTLHKLPSQWTTLLGIPEEVPFVVGASDGCLANLGAGAIVPGRAAITLGTSGAIRIFTPYPEADRRHYTFSSYILAENMYLMACPISNGGIALRWFRDQFGEAYVELAQKQHLDPYQLLSETAAQVAAGAEGLLFLPYLLGERAPIWDASARGVFLGIAYTHTRAHFLRAVMEGVIYSMYSAAQVLQRIAGEIDVLYANGGFVRSAMWVQMLADVFNKRVLVTESFESSALGAAFMGMHSLQKITYTDLEKFIHVSTSYDPDPIRHQAYMRNYRVFERLYEKLKDEFVLLQHPSLE